MLVQASLTALATLAILGRAAPAPQAYGADSSSSSSESTYTSSWTVAGGGITTVTVVGTSTLTGATPTSTVTVSLPASSTTSSSASTASQTSLSAVHQVTVGGGPLTYSPSFISAAIGDVVLFTFKQANHTLTQSSFASPCNHLTDATGAAIGLDSGFVPVAANATEFPVWALTVKVDTPLWFYCRQANHCESGMVFGLNAPATGNTFAAFLAKAEGISTATQTTWAPTASAKWSGSDVAAASSTGVVFPTLDGAAALPTSSKSSGAVQVSASAALGLVGLFFVALM